MPVPTDEKRRLLGVVERVMQLLSAAATGGSLDSDEYRRLRAVVMNDPETAPLMPAWLKQTRTLDDWWPVIKGLYPSYAERRTYVAKEFEEALSHFEDTYPGIVPIPSPVPERPPFGSMQEVFDVLYGKAAAPKPKPSPTPQTAAGSAPVKRRPRVFVVHGHDHGPRDSVALLIQRLGFEPLILEDQPNKGRTIIEKFEAYADVRYAVVVMTPDDMGGAKGGPPARARARQNVILELGFFIGRLGRENVAAVVAGVLEVPSDVDGVLYIPFDKAGAWREKLAKEMKAAGLPVDMNRL